MSKHYIINGKEIREAPLEEWAAWMETADRTVRKDVVNGLLVSTVFLSLDYNFSGGEPILFETMVFKHDTGTYESVDEDGFVNRYHTYEEAENGHINMIQKVKERFPTGYEETVEKMKQEFKKNHE